MSESVGAIIVAAGSGTRMGGVDKLFADLAGRALLARAIDPFQRCEAVERIVVVLSAENLERGKALLESGGFEKAAARTGGPRRQDSVRLGLEALGECEWVLVHDAARPLVTLELIERALAAAREAGAAIPVVPLVDTVKELSDDGAVARTLERDRLGAAQTPQAFRYELLARAHREMTADVTDDAQMLELMGIPVRTFEGDRRNMKVTTPEDLVLAEALLREESTKHRLQRTVDVRRLRFGRWGRR